MWSTLEGPRGEKCLTITLNKSSDFARKTFLYSSVLQKLRHHIANLVQLTQFLDEQDMYQTTEHKPINEF